MKGMGVLYARLPPSNEGLSMWKSQVNVRDRDMALVKRRATLRIK